MPKCIHMHMCPLHQMFSTSFKGIEVFRGVQPDSPAATSARAGKDENLREVGSHPGSIFTDFKSPKIVIRKFNMAAIDFP